MSASAAPAAAAAARVPVAFTESLESLEALVLDQLVSAVGQLEEGWDEDRRRDFVVGVLHASLGGEAPSADNSWPILDRFSLRTVKGICAQLALDVVEGPRAKSRMLEDVQDSLWRHWDQQRQASSASAEEPMELLDEDEKAEPTGAAAGSAAVMAPAVNSKELAGPLAAKHLRRR